MSVATRVSFTTRANPDTPMPREPERAFVPVPESDLVSCLPSMTTGSVHGWSERTRSDDDDPSDESSRSTLPCEAASLVGTGACWW